MARLIDFIYRPRAQYHVIIYFYTHLCVKEIYRLWLFVVVIINFGYLLWSQFVIWRKCKVNYLVLWYFHPRQIEYIKLVWIDFYLIAKVFSLFNTTVTNPAFAEYVESSQSCVASVGDSVFVKDIEGQAVEWKGGKFSIIIELP